MKFVVATDGSEQSDRALDHAFDLADAADATVTAIHVVTPQVRSEGGEAVDSLEDAADKLYIENLEESEERGERTLADVEEHANERGVNVTTELLYGDPAQQIVEWVHENDTDALFVGHRGLSERHEDLVGSVAKEVLRLSDVPVTVVR